MPNAMYVLYPYWHGDTWVFDDEAVDLHKEPFVFGVPEMLDELVAGIPDARGGFRLTFSTNPFPGYQRVAVWKREEHDGNWYSFEGQEHEGWLCPAMFKYLDVAPEKLYVRADPKGA